MKTQPYLFFSLINLPAFFMSKLKLFQNSFADNLDPSFLCNS